MKSGMKNNRVETIRILLIEDNHLLQDAITSMLHGQEEFVVVACSEDGDSIRQLKSLNEPPDVVLLDLGLATVDSLNLMTLIREESPDTRVIAMDILPENVDIIEFVRAGGDGFILKNAPSQAWIDTIKAVASGEKVLPPEMTDSLFTQVMNKYSGTEKEIPPDSIQLTPREREVVILISEGLSNKEIAQTLHIATFTVKSHVHNILEKLMLSTRLQIAAYVRKQEGLTDT
jgi:two-component system, NarL family, nitrate/nitrite response regulator NarL